jgi:MarR family transcriptional regulator, transcriptional regulator for hemolysin
MSNMNSLGPQQPSMKRDRPSSRHAQALNEFGFLLKDVSRLNTRHFEQCALPLGLTLGQCKVILYLSCNEGTTQARLAELSETDPMTLVRIIDRMENDGLIERSSDASDRRAHRLRLGTAAQGVLAEIRRVGARARSEVLAGLSTAEQLQLMTLLGRVHDNLSGLTPSRADSTDAAGVLSPRCEPDPQMKGAAPSGARKRRKTPA